MRPEEQSDPRENESFDSSRGPVMYFELPEFKFAHSPNSSDNMDHNFMGRTEHLQRLRMLLEESRSESGTYLVTGYRGSGKTTFVTKAIEGLKPSIISKWNLYPLLLAIFLFNWLLAYFMQRAFPDLQAPTRLVLFLLLVNGLVWLPVFNTHFGKFPERDSLIRKGFKTIAYAFSGVVLLSFLSIQWRPVSLVGIIVPLAYYGVPWLKSQPKPRWNPAFWIFLFAAFLPPFFREVLWRDFDGTLIDHLMVYVLWASAIAGCLILVRLFFNLATPQTPLSFFVSLERHQSPIITGLYFFLAFEALRYSALFCLEMTATNLTAMVIAGSLSIFFFGWATMVRGSTRGEALARRRTLQGVGFLVLMGSLILERLFQNGQHPGFIDKVAITSFNFNLILLSFSFAVFLLWRLHSLKNHMHIEMKPLEQDSLKIVLIWNYFVDFLPWLAGVLLVLGICFPGLFLGLPLLSLISLFWFFKRGLLLRSSGVFKLLRHYFRPFAKIQINLSHELLGEKQILTLILKNLKDSYFGSVGQRTLYLIISRLIFPVIPALLLTIASWYAMRAPATHLRELAFQKIFFKPGVRGAEKLPKHYEIDIREHQESAGTTVGNRALSDVDFVLVAGEELSFSSHTGIKNPAQSLAHPILAAIWVGFEFSYQKLLYRFSQPKKEGAPFKMVAYFNGQAPALYKVLDREGLSPNTRYGFHFFGLVDLYFPRFVPFLFPLWFMGYLLLLAGISRFFWGRNIIRQMNQTLARLSAEYEHQTKTESSGRRLYFTVGQTKRWKHGPLDVREVEQAIISQLKQIRELPFFLVKPRFIFIFDELDKIEPNLNLVRAAADDPELDSEVKSDQPGPLHVRERRFQIETLFGNLKHILTTSRAFYIFVAGRELFDAGLADFNSRYYLYSTIFDHTFYIESFLSEKSDNKFHDVTSFVEAFVVRQLIPAPWRDVMARDYWRRNGRKKKYFDLKDYSDYLHQLSQTKVNQTQNIYVAVLFLKHFINYLTYRGKGSPKKIITLFEHNVVLGNREPEVNNRVYGYRSGDAFLRFYFYDQYIISFQSSISLLFFRYLNSTLKNYGDKLSINVLYMIDHYLKFHRLGFSQAQLELMPDHIDIHKAPQVRPILSKILDVMRQNIIAPIQSGLYDYRFIRRIGHEIQFISKISDMEDAAYNFTLDESLQIKQFFRGLLAKESKKHQHMLDQGRYVYSISYLNACLGDLHMFDEQYDEALVHFRNSVEVITWQLKDEKVLFKESLVKTSESFFRYYFYLRVLLKMGLLYERRQMLNSALGIYKQASSIVHKILEAFPNMAIDPKKLAATNPLIQFLEDLRLLTQPDFAMAYVLEKMHRSSHGSLTVPTLFYEQFERWTLPKVEHFTRLTFGGAVEHFFSLRLFKVEYCNKIGNLMFFRDRAMYPEKPPADKLNLKAEAKREHGWVDDPPSSLEGRRANQWQKTGKTEYEVIEDPQTSKTRKIKYTYEPDREENDGGSGTKEKKNRLFDKFEKPTVEHWKKVELEANVVIAEREREFQANWHLQSPVKAYSQAIVENLYYHFSNQDGNLFKALGLECAENHSLAKLVREFRSLADQSFGSSDAVIRVNGKQIRFLLEWCFRAVLEPSKRAAKDEVDWPLQLLANSFSYLSNALIGGLPRADGQPAAHRCDPELNDVCRGQAHINELLENLGENFYWVAKKDATQPLEKCFSDGFGNHFFYPFAVRLWSALIHNRAGNKFQEGQQYLSLLYYLLHLVHIQNYLSKKPSQKTQPSRAKICLKGLKHLVLRGVYAFSGSYRDSHSVFMKDLLSDLEEIFKNTESGMTINVAQMALPSEIRELLVVFNFILIQSSPASPFRQRWHYQKDYAIKLPMHPVHRDWVNIRWAYSLDPRNLNDNCLVRINEYRLEGKRCERVFPLLRFWVKTLAQVYHEDPKSLIPNAGSLGDRPFFVTQDFFIETELNLPLELVDCPPAEENPIREYLKEQIGRVNQNLNKTRHFGETDFENFLVFAKVVTNEGLLESSPEDVVEKLKKARVDAVPDGNHWQRLADLEERQSFESVRIAMETVLELFKTLDPLAVRLLKISYWDGKISELALIGLVDKLAQARKQLEAGQKAYKGFLLGLFEENAFEKDYRFRENVFLCLAGLNEGFLFSYFDEDPDFLKQYRRCWKRRFLAPLMSSIFCYYEALKFINTFGNSYILPYFLRGETRFRLAQRLILLRYYRGYLGELEKSRGLGTAMLSGFKEDVEEVIREYYSPSKFHQVDQISDLLHGAKRDMGRVGEVHKMGNAYYELIGQMYYLDDDFKDETQHLFCALERFIYKSGAIESLEEEIEVFRSVATPKIDFDRN